MQVLGLLFFGASDAQCGLGEIVVWPNVLRAPPHAGDGVSTPSKARPIRGEGFEISCSLYSNNVARDLHANYPVKARPTAAEHAVARVPRECRLRIGGHSSHVAPRFCTERERGLPPMQYPFVERKLITASAARHAREASLRVLPPPEIQPAQWGLRACHANAGCALEVTARTSHHGLARKERVLPPMRCPYIVQGPTAASAARRARAAS